MCGIAGIAALSPVNRDAVQAMTDLMVHRGPDGEGQWLNADGRVCFGHRRLAIIDLTDRAAQPMQDAQGSLSITYNGEIYNYKEIRAELAEAGVRFNTDSDTEVVLESYRKWGDACLDRFNGMFAFALHDQKAKRILCARDRFGEKPFLFSHSRKFFAFASEYKALAAVDGVRTDIHAPLLAQFLVTPSNGLDQGRQTLFRDVGQLLPGEKLVLNTDDLSFEISSYWQPPMEADATAQTEADTVAVFRDLLEDAVRIRLRSDVPVGSCLSGGLDSSAITCLARGLIGNDRPYDVFIGRFPDTKADEGYWADLVAVSAHATTHETFPTGENLVRNLDGFLWLNELPVDSASQFAQWCVFETAKKAEVTVLLDGQGSDEILAGYEQYFTAYIASRRAAGDHDAAEEKAIRDRYPMAFSQSDQGWKDRIPLFAKKLISQSLGGGTDIRLALNGDLARSATEMDAPHPNGLHAVLRRDSFNGFLTTLLRYGDRNSMAHSREVRLPFCDHRIAEFVATLPVGMLMGNAQTKYLLRKAMTGTLPEQIATRWNKQGFLPPVVQWLNGGLGNYADDLFSDAAFRETPHWDAAWCRQAWQRFRRGDTGLAPTIWKILVSEAWRQKTLGRLSSLPGVAPTA